MASAGNPTVNWKLIATYGASGTEVHQSGVADYQSETHQFTASANAVGSFDFWKHQR